MSDDEVNDAIRERLKGLDASNVDDMIKQVVGEVYQEPERLLEMLPELISESDRTVAIVGTAFLDTLIEELLAGFFVEAKESKQLLDQGNQIDGFRVRVKLAYALGLLREREYRELRIINDIRNRFAHEFHAMSFENEAVMKECQKLHIGPVFVRSLGLAAELIGAQIGGFSARELPAREKYQMAVIQHLSALITRISTIEKTGARRVVWPEIGDEMTEDG